MRPRTLLRIARWESTKGVGGIDRGAVAVAVAAVAFALAVGAVAVVGGVALEDGIYRVGVDEGSPYHDPVAEDPTFAVVDPAAGVDTGPASPTGVDGLAIGGFAGDDRYDLYIDDRPDEMAIYLAVEDGEPTGKSLAALASFRNAVEQYNDRQMLAEDNQTAAFPVTVTMQFVERDRGITVAPPEEQIDDETDDEAAPADEDDETAPGAPDGDDTDTDADDGAIGAPSLGAFDLFGAQQTTGSPSDIQPPFPFQSLVLAFLFVLPLNFLIQAYGSSMLSERLDRRGELLLVAPVSRSEIVFGKTLPYIAASIAIAAVIVGGLRVLGATAGALSVAAVVPLALLFLGTTFLGAMFARSFKELTFVTVTISTVLTTYAFVPAIFAETSRVAFVSPLTLAIKDLTGAGVTAAEFVFSTGPPTLVAALCFLLGIGIYREEDLFTQRPVHRKAMDALAARIHRPRSVAVVVALLVPFVFIAELLAVALLFALPVTLSIPLVFAVIAVIEELAKGLPIYAGFESSRYERTLGVAIAAGIASGVGFFLAEKLTLAVQLVGLPELAVADAAFQTGFGTGDVALIAVLALAPLALHVVTATISSLGAKRGRGAFAAGLAVAMLVHLIYNVAVVSTLV